MNRPKRIYARSEDVLFLFKSGQHPRLIAERTGIKEASVRRTLLRHGIYQPRSYNSWSTKAEFLRVWNSCSCVPEVASHFKVTIREVRNKASNLRVAGLKLKKMPTGYVQLARKWAAERVALRDKVAA